MGENEMKGLPVPQAALPDASKQVLVNSNTLSHVLATGCRCRSVVIILQPELLMLRLCMTVTNCLFSQHAMHCSAASASCQHVQQPPLL